LRGHAGSAAHMVGMTVTTADRVRSLIRHGGRAHAGASWPDAGDAAGAAHFMSMNDNDNILVERLRAFHVGDDVMTAPIPITLATVRHVKNVVVSDASVSIGDHNWLSTAEAIAGEWWHHDHQVRDVRPGLAMELPEVKRKGYSLRCAGVAVLHVHSDEWLAKRARYDVRYAAILLHRQREATNSQSQSQSDLGDAPDGVVVP